MLYFGRISYSLYLAHLPVLIVVTGVLVKLLPDSLPARMLGILVGIAAAIVAAHLLHRFVEARAIRGPSASPPADRSRQVAQRAWSRTHDIDHTCSRCRVRVLRPGR